MAAQSDSEPRAPLDKMDPGSFGNMFSYLDLTGDLPTVSKRFAKYTEVERKKRFSKYSHIVVSEYVCSPDYDEKGPWVKEVAAQTIQCRFHNTPEWTTTAVLNNFGALKCDFWFHVHGPNKALPWPIPGWFRYEEGLCQQELYEGDSLTFSFSPPPHGGFTLSDYFAVNGFSFDFSVHPPWWPNDQLIREWQQPVPDYDDTVDIERSTATDNLVDYEYELNKMKMAQDYLAGKDSFVSHYHMHGCFDFF